MCFCSSYVLVRQSGRQLPRLPVQASRSCLVRRDLCISTSPLCSRFECRCEFAGSTETKRLFGNKTVHVLLSPRLSDLKVLYRQSVRLPVQAFRSCLDRRGLVASRPHRYVAGSSVGASLPYQQKTKMLLGNKAAHVPCQPAQVV